MIIAFMAIGLLLVLYKRKRKTMSIISVVALRLECSYNLLKINE